MKKTLETIIFIALIASTLTSLIISLVTDTIVNINFYVGFVGVLIALGLRIKSVKVSNYILGIILILGTFNIVEFSYIHDELSFSIFGFNTFGINIISLLLLFLFSVANKEIIQSIAGNSNNETAKEQRIKMDESYIESFMQKNEEKSIDELQEIINNPEKYVKQLVIAAERLVEKKRNVL